MTYQPGFPALKLLFTPLSALFRTLVLVRIYNSRLALKDLLAALEAKPIVWDSMDASSRRDVRDGQPAEVNDTRIF